MYSCCYWWRWWKHFISEVHAAVIFLHKSGDFIVDKTEDDEGYRCRALCLWWNCFLSHIEELLKVFTIYGGTFESDTGRLLHIHFEIMCLSMFYIFDVLWKSVRRLTIASSYRQSVTCWGKWCWPGDDLKDCTPWEDLRTEVTVSIHLDWI